MHSPITLKVPIVLKMPLGQPLGWVTILLPIVRGFERPSRCQATSVIQIEAGIAKRR